MRQCLSLLACLAVLALVATSHASAQLTNYVFSSGTGIQFDVSNGTSVYTGRSGSGGITYQSTGTFPIGFTFNFAGTNYTQFSISVSGIMGLGPSVVTSSPYNGLQSSSYPAIAPFWDNLRASGGVQGCGKPNVRYITTGVAPGRILIVEWTDMDMQWYTPAFGTFQARLYESGRIEFWYGRMSSCDVCNQFRGCVSTSATIGIANSSSDYMSVTPNGGGATMSRVSVNDYFNLNGTAIAIGEMYSFIPCTAKLTGRFGPGNGGTVTMANGDTFFSGFLTQVGSQSVYKPFDSRMSDGACAGSLTMTISGAASSDYYFGTPGTLSKVVNLGSGFVDTADITFKPTVGGLRPAVLTVTGPGLTRTFNLAGRAPLVNYTGNVPQGGTTGMNTGDTLFKGIPVPRHGSQCFTPFMLTDVSGASQFIDYTLVDPTGQYSISPDTTIGPYGVTTPRICFNPTRFGPQSATLTVNAGGEPRTFTLLAISAAPGGDLRVDGVPLDTASQMFRNVFSCAGEQAITIPVNMVNTGYNDFQINKIEFYRIDSVYGQGTPRYPYLRDSRGALIPSEDYVLTTQPGVAPLKKNVVTLPIVVPQGTSRTIYMTFVGHEAGKRFARAVIRTNGQSSSGYDTTGLLIEGILSFDLYGRGSSSRLSDRVDGGLPQAITFGDIKLKNSVDATLPIVNNGVCPLRINLDQMAIVAGDVEEFEVVTKPSSNVDPVTHDLLLAPGASDNITLRFHPIQVGSRRAGLRLVTNDSTIEIPGVTERGVYYVDLYGTGKADLYGEGTDISPALIGGGAPEHTFGTVRFKNTRSNPVQIDSLYIEGADAADFTPSSLKGWPTFPHMLDPGENFELEVEFAPQSTGQPGNREIWVVMITSSGDTVRAKVRSVAGTRTILVSPLFLNFGTLTSGKEARQTVTIKNDGTLPLKITGLNLASGVDFRYTNLTRMELAPGQSEFLEVTYEPSGPGAASTTLDIQSNGTNGTQSVQLSGTAVRTRGRIDDPSVTLGGGTPGLQEEVVGMAENLSVSGVVGVRSSEGIMLFQNKPNPGRGLVEISYILPQRADATLSLYDNQGRLVRVIDAGIRPAGTTSVQVDVTGLAAGVYHYRLITGGTVLARQLNVVH